MSPCFILKWGIMPPFISPCHLIRRRVFLRICSEEYRICSWEFVLKSIAYRWTDNCGTARWEALVQWKTLANDNTTCEIVEDLRFRFPKLNLEDKVRLDGGGDDGIPHSAPPVTNVYKRRKPAEKIILWEYIFYSKKMLATRWIWELYSDY